jgi:Sulfotransferase family
VRVSEPLVLVSQVQRSGGTLLSQLFDGHPQLHAHPDELKIGFPKKHDWPPLDLEASAEEWLEILEERAPRSALATGYRKSSRAAAPKAVDEIFPFLYSPSVQRAVFLASVASPAATEREILDAYFTAYFNAWLDNRNLAGTKRYVTAFAPRLSMAAGNRTRFRAAYPDGALISIVRDPRSWWCSAREHKPALYGDRDAAIAVWRASTEAAVQAHTENPLRTIVLRYETLVDDPAGQMQRLCARLGLTFDDCLLTPTFNGRPIKSNSTREIREHGVIAGPRDRHREELAKDDERAILTMTEPLLETLRRLA